MKDNVHAEKKNPWMDNIHHVVYGGRWHIRWILMVEEK
jgi:hypothetical protein